MSHKQEVDEILQNVNIKTLLYVLMKWVNLKAEQLAKLMGVDIKQIRRWFEVIQPHALEDKDKGINLVIYKMFPESKTRLYSISSYGMRRLGFTKEVRKSPNTIVKIPRYKVKFNFYEVEHTDWCIKALFKELNISKENKLQHNKYFTAREVGFAWTNVYSQIKDILHSGVEERRPDLVMKNPSTNKYVCIEVENTPKNSRRMLIVLRSLSALGDYAKRFNLVKIYANENNGVYRKWNNLIPYVDENNKPEHLELIKLHETLDSL